MRKLCVIFIITTMIACNSKSQEHQIDNTQDDTENNCNIYEPELCKNPSDCSYIYGYKFNKQRSCFEEEVIVGCLPKGSVCGASLSKAIDLEGNCWLFPSTCTPRGWKQPEQGCGISTLDFCPENDPKECVDMDYGTCKRKSDQCKMVYGRMFEKKSGCLSTKTYIGCISKESQCNTSTVTATYSENCYHIPFGENCIPSNMKHEHCYVDADICEWEK